jgi:hypothetical protein
VNQVLGEEDSEIFASRVANGQIQSIERLQRSVSSLSNPPLITKVAYLDSEPRGVYGLKALAHEMVVEELESNATPHFQTNKNV